MTRSTYTLHEKLIRAHKGMIAAWEEWLKAQPRDHDTAPVAIEKEYLRIVIQVTRSWEEWLKAQKVA